MFSRRKIAALAAEFLGTGVLSFVVLTVSRSQIGIPYFVAIAAGLAVVLLGLGLDRDVQLNPAYTLALWTARRVKTLKAIMFIIVQLLGGMAAYALYKYFSGGHVQPLPTAFESKILIAEAFGTFIFSFLAAGALYRQGRPLVRMITTGGGYAVGVMVASVAAAGFINPAVALASNAWAWLTYVAGPLLGAVIGVNLYALLFAPDGPSFRRKTAKSSAVVEHIKEDKEAVKADRLAKVEEAKEEAVAEREADDDFDDEDDEDEVEEVEEKKPAKESKPHKKKNKKKK